ncbi:hypothetical protein J6N69_03255 [bacterium]|nr:hypothetical protein [bacterium]MBP3847491.1 hypothetical protein [bacterium]
MQLTIHDYNKKYKRLEYAQTPAKPRFAPAYIISGKRADEFVKKYNKQSESLIKNSILMTASGTIIGCGMALSQSSKKIGIIMKSLAGAVVGLAGGIIISQQEKNKLMDEYHVEEV